MEEHKDGEGLGWEQTLDRRALLEKAAVAGGALVAGGLLADRARAVPWGGSPGDVTFLSTQLNTVSESEAFRTTLVPGFAGRVEAIFATSDAEFENRIRAEARANRGTIDVLGALHGSFSTLEDRNTLMDLSDLARQFTAGRRPIEKSFMTLGKLGTNRQYYIPWIQATYVMVANKRVLPLLPRGANINRLTYGQLNQWSKAVKARYGSRMGFPAATNGLIHRYFQGYLVPAFSGGVVTTFRTPQAYSGWAYQKALWNHVHAQSQTYGFMQDPLLNEEVLMAWEHVARLRNALMLRPDSFVVFPAPRGPKGLAYMPVLAGLAIPRNAPNPNGAKALIRHLLSASTQAKTLSAVGFFPVIGGRLSTRISPGLRAMSNAVKIQQGTTIALPSLLPIGLGTEGGNFNAVFRNVFTRTVLRGEPIQSVLNEEAQTLQAIMDKTGARCWRPDPASRGACKVK